MDLLLAVCLGLVVGVTLTALIPRLLARGPNPVEVETQVRVPEGLSQMLGVLRSAGVVVGPHDEVLQATDQARTLGLVRGARVMHPELLTLVRGVREDDEIRARELHLPRGVGEQHAVFAVRVAPLPDDLVVILAEDRTSAVRLEAIRRDFVANVSHELKTPIGAISLLAEAVAEASDDPEAVQRFSSRMQHESARLGELVAQIIQLSGVQGDDPLAAPTVVGIDDVVAEAIDVCRVDAEQRRITLTVTGLQDLTVLGDSGQLSMALSNLVRNAVVYSDPGARVVVAPRRRDRGGESFVEISITDNGIGIAQEEQERIFERFYRVDYARSRANGGNGLGLSIVKHIAAAHGGEVSVWSSPGRGSTFTVAIPEHLPDPGEDPGRDSIPADREQQELKA